MRQAHIRTSLTARLPSIMEDCMMPLVAPTHQDVNEIKEQQSKTDEKINHMQPTGAGRVEICDIRTPRKSFRSLAGLRPHHGH